MDDPNPGRFDEQNEAAVVLQRAWRAHLDKKRKKAEAARADDDDGERQRERDGADDEDTAAADLLTRYKAAVEEQQRLFARNARCQIFLSAHQDEKKVSDLAAERCADVDAGYVRLLGRLYHEHTAFAALRDDHEHYLQEFEARSEAHLGAAQQHITEYRQLRDAVLLGGDDTIAAAAAASDPFHGSGGGSRRVAALKGEIEEMDREDERRDAELQKVRVEYLRQRTRQRRLAKAMRDRDRVAAKGLHLIDFEQLKIENASWNEKIEERNEDLLKMRKKATTTIHILTHIKEKLTFCSEENKVLRATLAEIDGELVAARGTLAKLKRERDTLSSDTVRMRDKTPLVGAHDLLVDFETRKAQVAVLQDEVARLRAHHQALVAYVAGYQTVFRSASTAAAARAPTLLASVAMRGGAGGGGAGASSADAAAAAAGGAGGFAFPSLSAAGGAVRTR